MKHWFCLMSGLALLAGCQAQSKPPTTAATPAVLNVAASAPRQASVYAMPPAAPASYASPRAGLVVPGYLPPEDSTTSAPPVAFAAPKEQVASRPATPASIRPSAKHVGETYVVKRGDTLFRIAKEHYGSGSKWRQIATANPGLTPANLKAGQKLLMP